MAFSTGLTPLKSLKRSNFDIFQFLFLIKPKAQRQPIHGRRRATHRSLFTEKLDLAAIGCESQAETKNTRYA